MSEKLYGKFKLEKWNGKPLDPRAKYFVLRYDAASSDIHARETLFYYADRSKFEELRQDVISEMEKAEKLKCDSDFGSGEGT